MVTGVMVVTRRLKAEPGLLAQTLPSVCTSTTDRPWIMSSLSISAAGRGNTEVPPLAWMKKELSFSSVVASWFMASRPRELKLSDGLPEASRPNHSMPSWWSPARLPNSPSVPSFLKAGVLAVSGSPRA